MWLRQHGPDTSQAAFDRRLADLGLRRKPIVSPDGGKVAIALFDRRRDGVFSLKLRTSPELR